MTARHWQLDTGTRTWWLCPDAPRGSWKMGEGNVFERMNRRTMDRAVVCPGREVARERTSRMRAQPRVAEKRTKETIEQLTGSGCANCA
jgi:hypothetical protein